MVFRYHNDGHPNQTCALLVANLFYAALTGKSPEGLEFDTVVETKAKDGKDPDGGELKVVFEGEEKAYLQRMAESFPYQLRRQGGSRELPVAPHREGQQEGPV